MSLQSLEDLVIDACVQPSEIREHVQKEERLEEVKEYIASCEYRSYLSSMGAHLVFAMSA